MENKKTLGIALLVVGVVVMAVSLFADQFGIGGTAVFGYKQSIGAVLGAGIAAAGFFWTTNNAKLTSTLLVIGGVILLAFSLFADMLGIGGTPGFGYNQVIGAVAGVLSAAAGYFLSKK